MVSKKKIKRPARQKKSDRIIHGAKPSTEVACDFAVAPVQRALDEMDRKWGVDRLPELVSPETAVKYGKAVATLHNAIDTQDVEKATQWAGVCIRGLAVMDKEAEASGAPAASQSVWEVELNGTVYGIMQDGRSWKTIQEQRPDLKLVTLREVAVAIEWWSQHNLGQMIEAAKANFPNAEIINSNPTERTLEDDIGF